MTTTDTTPAVTDFTAFKAAARELFMRAFEPASPAAPEGTYIPGEFATSDERRAYALLSAQLYAQAGQKDAALAWRIRHAYEAGVISKPAKWRYAAVELAGKIGPCEAETRNLIRGMAMLRIAERTALATERTATATELNTLVVMVSALGKELGADTRAKLIRRLETWGNEQATSLPAPTPVATAVPKAA